ncbi:MAG: hypothetical protein R2875_00265 [Desulfobacterales bacterium]
MLVLMIHGTCCLTKKLINLFSPGQGFTTRQTVFSVIDGWGQADMPLLSLWGYDKYQKIGNAHGGCLSQSAANRKCYGVKYGNVFSLPYLKSQIPATDNGWFGCPAR